MSQMKGHISQVIGPVVDVYFEGKNIDEALLLGHKIVVIEDGVVKREFFIATDSGERDLLSTAFINLKREIINELDL